MGLSGPKQKQRIGHDPRNLAWADSANRFGHAYLSKLGWTAESGLGANLDGRTSHIAVAHKLDMLGIGANRPDGPEAIAWKQNKDFESVLERLNQAQNADSQGSSASSNGEEDKDEERRKRKEERRKRKEERARRKEEKRRKKAEKLAQEKEANVVEQPKVVRMAHRARHRAAKGMLGASAAALAEVLGESSSNSLTPSGTVTPRPTLTPVSDTPEVENLKTSTINMSDYFKTRIQAKIGASTDPIPSSSTSDRDDSESPRAGLGSSFRGSMLKSSYGPSALTGSKFVQSKTVTTSVEEEIEPVQPAVVTGSADIEPPVERSKKRSKSSKPATSDGTPDPVEVDKPRKRRSRAEAELEDSEPKKKRKKRKSGD